MCRVRACVIVHEVIAWGHEVGKKRRAKIVDMESINLSIEANQARAYLVAEEGPKHLPYIALCPLVTYILSLRAGLEPCKRPDRPYAAALEDHRLVSPLHTPRLMP